jgi:hypothetical protein
VSFSTTTLCVASHRDLIFASLYFVTDSVRKLKDTPSYSASGKKTVTYCGIFVVTATRLHLIYTLSSLVRTP